MVYKDWGLQRPGSTRTQTKLSAGSGSTRTQHKTVYKDLGLQGPKTKTVYKDPHEWSTRTNTDKTTLGLQGPMLLENVSLQGPWIYKDPMNERPPKAVILNLDNGGVNEPKQRQRIHPPSIHVFGKLYTNKIKCDLYEPRKYNK